MVTRAFSYSVLSPYNRGGDGDSPTSLLKTLVPWTTPTTEKTHNGGNYWGRVQDKGPQKTRFGAPNPLQTVL